MTTIVTGNLSVADGTVVVGVPKLKPSTREIRALQSDSAVGVTEVTVATVPDGVTKAIINTLSYSYVSGSYAKLYIKKNGELIISCEAIDTQTVTRNYIIDVKPGDTFSRYYHMQTASSGAAAVAYDIVFI